MFRLLAPLFCWPLLPRARRLAFPPACLSCVCSRRSSQVSLGVRMREDGACCGVVLGSGSRNKTLGGVGCWWLDTSVYYSLLTASVGTFLRAGC